MREKELRALANCSICGNKILATGLPLFWRVRIERFGVDLHAVQRLQGLTLLLGGYAQLASVMGPDEDLAQPVMDEVTLAVCETCALSGRHSIAGLAELAS